MRKDGKGGKEGKAREGKGGKKEGTEGKCYITPRFVFFTLHIYTQELNDR
jgi:hypothetical protein